MQTILLVSSVVLWIVVGFNILLTIALIQKVNEITTPSQPETLEVGEDAPDFKIEGLNGAHISSDNFRDSGLLMVFVSPTCLHCRPHMPVLNEIYPKARRDDVDIAVVGLGDVDEIKKFAQEFSLEMPVGVTQYTSEFATKFKVPGTPSYYMIGKDGKVQSVGFFDEQWHSIIEQWKSHSA